MKSCNNSVYITRLENYKISREWFFNHYDELVKKFDKEFVAIYKQQLIDHGKDVRELMKRIRKKYADKGVFVEYVTSEKIELVL